MIDVLINKKAHEEQEKAEAFVESFKAVHSSLSEKNKEILREKCPLIETEEQAKGVMSLMKMMSAIDKVKELGL